MNIFLSWSGSKSRKIAEAFSEWLPCVIQASKPWFSQNDLDRGSVWFTEIYDHLSKSDLGIIFVTKDNQSKPWVLFESGALSKGLTERRVCTFLVDLKVRDIDSGSPLSQLNHTECNEDDILKLLKTINKALDEKSVKEEVLEKSFRALWSDFKKALDEVLNEIEEVENIPEREDKDVLNDILDRVLRIDRKVSSGSSRRGKYIDQPHAEEIVDKFLMNGVQQHLIFDILDEAVPAAWLNRYLKKHAEGDFEEECEEN